MNTQVAAPAAAPVPAPAPAPAPVPPPPPAMTTISHSASSAPSTYVMSRTQEFERGGRRSSSDYMKFTSREQWQKWQRSLVGNAMEHKCEKVLDPSYVPDPTDADEVSLCSNVSNVSCFPCFRRP